MGEIEKENILYGEPASWWPLLSPPSDHEEEAGIYARALLNAAPRRPATLLELGSGGGNNASFLKKRFFLTPVDRSVVLLREGDAVRQAPMDEEREMQVFIEAEAGSFEKGRYDEATFERLGTRRANRPYPYPYGFIVGTRTGDGEALDCYVVTNDRLRQGSRVECEPIGLLEMTEDGEADCKVLAALPGRAVRLEESLRKTLADFILGIFTAFPEVEVEIGRLLPASAALEAIERNRVP